MKVEKLIRFASSTNWDTQIQWHSVVYLLFVVELGIWEEGVQSKFHSLGIWLPCWVLTSFPRWCLKSEWQNCKMSL